MICEFCKQQMIATVTFFDDTKDFNRSQVLMRCYTCVSQIDITEMYRTK